MKDSLFKPLRYSEIKKWCDIFWYNTNEMNSNSLDKKNNKSGVSHVYFCGDNTPILVFESWFEETSWEKSLSCIGSNSPEARWYERNFRSWVSSRAVEQCACYHVAPPTARKLARLRAISGWLKSQGKAALLRFDGILLVYRLCWKAMWSATILFTNISAPADPWKSPIGYRNHRRSEYRERG